jgi:hypothetical protein
LRVVVEVELVDGGLVDVEVEGSPMELDAIELREGNMRG